VQSAPLTSSEKTEVLRRQAFKCNRCQADLEPIGRTPAHFFRSGPPPPAKGAPATANVVALCPSCRAKSDSDQDKHSEAKKKRQRDSEPARTAKKFVKTGFDTRKF
jgi:5-methylcytosine-specific restriction endonuclease McrA